MRVVVTGCGRTGTQYLCNLLALSGFRSCHETVYNHSLDPFHPDLEKIEERWKPEIFECSWEAVPFISCFPDDIVVWHQIRHPLKSLRCWVHHHMLREDNGTCKLIHSVLPECGVGSDLERAVLYLWKWNRLTEEYCKNRPYYRYRVENFDEKMLLELLEQSGYCQLDRGRVEFAFKNSITNNGTCGHTEKDDISWEQVLSVPGGKELRQMTLDYGYEN